MHYSILPNLPTVPKSLGEGVLRFTSIRDGPGMGWGDAVLQIGLLGVLSGLLLRGSEETISDVKTANNETISDIKTANKSNLYQKGLCDSEAEASQFRAPIWLISHVAVQCT